MATKKVTCRTQAYVYEGICYKRGEDFKMDSQDVPLQVKRKRVKVKKETGPSKTVATGPSKNR